MLQQLYEDNPLAWHDRSQVEFPTLLNNKVANSTSSKTPIEASLLLLKLRFNPQTTLKHKITKYLQIKIEPSSTNKRDQIVKSFIRAFHHSKRSSRESKEKKTFLHSCQLQMTKNLYNLVNNNEESRTPCLNHLDLSKRLVGSTKNLIVVIQIAIHFFHFSR